MLACPDLGRIQFRSALICAEMAEAGFARDLRKMLTSTLKLRLFITDEFNSYFKCNSEEVLLEIDAHIARLRSIIKHRRAS